MKWILIGLAATVAACQPSAPLGPPGQVTLSYSGASDSEFIFVLDNRSAQEIFLSVSKSFWSGVKPWGSVGCLAKDSSYEANNWPPLDGGNHREIINVPPEGRLQLRVDKGDFAAPRYRAGPCGLVLQTENHVIIRSNDFKP